MNEYEWKQAESNRKVIRISLLIGLATVIVGGLITFLVVKYDLDAAPPTTTSAPPAPVGETNCPDHFRDLALDGNQQASCWCDGPTARLGVAFGTAQYADNSTPCTAAIHSGAISRYGTGRITAQRTPGCPAYAASTYFDFSSASLATRAAIDGSSYIVVGYAAPSCSQSFADSPKAEAALRGAAPR